jgi:hypothetical protein
MPTPGKDRTMEVALFGDTVDKDRASFRGRNAGGGGREGEAKKMPGDQFHGSLPEEALVMLKQRVTLLLNRV